MNGNIRGWIYVGFGALYAKTLPLGNCESTNLFAYFSDTIDIAHIDGWVWDEYWEAFGVLVEKDSKLSAVNWSNIWWF